MINLKLFIQLLKKQLYLIIQGDTVYVDARWYRKTCDSFYKSEWELDKKIHEITQCRYFTYTNTNHIIKGTAWKWDEQEKRYK